VTRARGLTPVPLAPAGVASPMSLRGEIVTAIDLRTRLGLAPREPVRGDAWCWAAPSR
jgi:purine-binding chemotaxis protein CheW